MSESLTPTRASPLLSLCLLAMLSFAQLALPLASAHENQWNHPQLVSGGYASSGARDFDGTYGMTSGTRYTLVYWSAPERHLEITSGNNGQLYCSFNTNALGESWIANNANCELVDAGGGSDDHKIVDFTPVWAGGGTKASRIHTNADSWGGTSNIAKSWAGGAGAVENFTWPAGQFGFLFVKEAAPPPLGPANLTATRADGAVHLKWSTAKWALDYVVCRDTQPHPDVTHCGSYTSVRVVGNVTSYVDTPAANGVTYYYRVRSRDAIAAGEVSAEVSATPNAAPHLAGNLEGRVAVLSWDANAITAPTNFTLYRSNVAGNLTPYKTLLHTARGYNDPVSPGVTYYYAITATNATTTTPLSNQVEIDVPLMFTWEGNFSRVLPDAATVFINRTTTEDYWVDLVRFDPRTGLPRGDVMEARPWDAKQPFNYTFRWPQFRGSEQRDVGTYHVFITDGVGNYLDGVNFAINETWIPPSTVEQSFRLDDAGRSTLALESLDETNVVSASLQRTTERATAQTYLSRGIGWFLGDTFIPGIPNLALYNLLALFLFGIAVVTTGGRNGGGGR